MLYIRLTFITSAHLAQWCCAWTHFYRSRVQICAVAIISREFFSARSDFCWSPVAPEMDPHISTAWNFQCRSATTYAYVAAFKNTENISITFFSFITVQNPLLWRWLKDQFQSRQSYMSRVPYIKTPISNRSNYFVLLWMSLKNQIDNAASLRMALLFSLTVSDPLFIHLTVRHFCFSISRHQKWVNNMSCSSQ